MSTTPADEAVAAELVAARREGRGLTGFPGATPGTMTEAYAIQDAAMSQWRDTLVGWKIGYIPDDRRGPGQPDRLVGPIWQRSFHLSEEHEGPVAVGIFARGFAAVEAELVIRLSQDLPPHPEGDWTAAEAAALDQDLLFGIEVASSPIPDINSLGPTVIAADFGNNNGLVLGPALGSAADAPSTLLACFIDGQLIAEGTGENLPGGIHHGLANALSVISRRGHAVTAGTLFATGAITGIHPIGPGQHCRVSVRGGASVELRTADARSLDPAGQV
ncbi:MAG: hypothetical protein ABWX96_10770 [Propionibacteriaceae bacterium]